MPDVLKNISTHDRFDMENRRVFKERVHKYWRVPMYTSAEASNRHISCIYPHVCVTNVVYEAMCTCLWLNRIVIFAK